MVLLRGFCLLFSVIVCEKFRAIDILKFGNLHGHYNYGIELEPAWLLFMGIVII